MAPYKRKPRNRRSVNSGPEYETEDQIHAREELVWKLRTSDFMTQQQIGTEVGVSQAAVSQILKRAAEKHRIQLATAVVTVQTEQLRMLSAIASEAWQAWRRSVARKKTSVQRRTYEDQTPMPAKPSKAMVRYIGKRYVETIAKTNAEEDGNPHYLAIAIRALEDIRKITGADAPQKLTVTDARELLSKLTGVPQEALPSGPEDFEQLARVVPDQIM